MEAIWTETMMALAVSSTARSVETDGSHLPPMRSNVARSANRGPATRLRCVVRGLGRWPTREPRFGHERVRPGVGWRGSFGVVLPKSLLIDHGCEV